VKERLVTCNEEDTDGRARVTRDEEPRPFATANQFESIRIDFPQL